MHPEIPVWLNVAKLVANPLATFFVIFFGSWFSEDGAMLASAFFWREGKIDGNIVYWANSVGVSCGDLLLYYIGFQISFGLERSWLRSIVKTKAMEKGRAFFVKWGNWFTFVARFVPGLRVPAFATAGFLRSPFAPFGAIVFLTALFWVGVQMFLFEAAGDHIGVQDIFFIGLVALVLTRWILKGFDDDGWKRRWETLLRLLKVRIEVRILKGSPTDEKAAPKQDEAPRP